MLEHRVEHLEHRADRQEAHEHEQDQEIAKNRTGLAVLQSRWEDMRGRHASARAWVGIIISASISLAALGVSVWLAWG